MQYRIVARRGTLVFGGVSFSTRPAIYEMSAEEVSVIHSLYGDRLLLELVEPEAVVQESQAAADDGEPEEPEPEHLEPEQEAGEPDRVESGRPRIRRRSAAAGPPSGEHGESEGV